jgi:hypothetical protein
LVSLGEKGTEASLHRVLKPRRKSPVAAAKGHWNITHSQGLFGYTQIHPNPHGLGGIAFKFYLNPSQTTWIEVELCVAKQSLRKFLQRRKLPTRNV